jgi:hypothetical protein
MRVLSLILSSVALIGCATQESLGSDIKFYRDTSPENPVMVTLRWKAALDPAFYTPRGSMTEISISELGKTASVPSAELYRIEDIWPEDAKLYSTKLGDYELILPYGVGEKSAGIFKIRDFHVVQDSAPLETSSALRRK